MLSMAGCLYLGTCAVVILGGMSEPGWPRLRTGRRPAAVCRQIEPSPTAGYAGPSPRAVTTKVGAALVLYVIFAMFILFL